MRTSLTEIAQTEKYLMRKMDEGTSLVFEATMLANPLMRWHVFLQKKIYSILQFYHRKKLKEDLSCMHDQIFSDPMNVNFKDQILSQFKH